MGKIFWGAQRAMMSYKIIANPVAGKGRAIALIDQVRIILKERKAEFDFELTKAPGHAADIARSAAECGCEVIVSAGWRWHYL